jgi:hypothetical protein
VIRLTSEHALAIPYVVSLASAASSLLNAPLTGPKISSPIIASLMVMKTGST